MNGDFYFEQNPWNRACECIDANKLGKMLHVSAQCVCEKGEKDSTLQKWKDRVTALAGDECRGNALQAGNAISYVGVFGDNAVVRFFIDDGAEDVSENFEIVTEKSLIVWKPNGTNQGHMLSSEGCFIEASQEYVEDLEV